MVSKPNEATSSTSAKSGPMSFLKMGSRETVHGTGLRERGASRQPTIVA